MPSVVAFVGMPSVAEDVDVSLVGTPSDALPVPSPARLKLDEAELVSTSEAALHSIDSPICVISVILVQSFGSIVFSSSAGVSVGRLSARRRRVPPPGSIS
jgi:hypothetical protein